MNKSKKKGIVGIILTIIILILLVIVTNTDIAKVSYVENIVSTLVMPVQNGLTYLKNKIEGNNSFFENVDALKAENDELKKKNSELEQTLREYEIVKSENDTLKEYVNLKDKYKQYKTIPAYVINKDVGNYSNTVVINVGEKDGIKENMTVIAQEGLVGHVISTTESTAKVQTIVDTATAVTGTISTTKDAIIIQGTLESDKILNATYIPTDASILQGDSVETSGIGGIYPKGIHIGTIKEIINTNNIIDRYATVETAVDFSKLATVLVILNTN